MHSKDRQIRGLHFNSVQTELLGLCDLVLLVDLLLLQAKRDVLLFLGEEAGRIVHGVHLLLRWLLATVDGVNLLASLQIFKVALPKSFKKR